MVVVLINPHPISSAKDDGDRFPHPVLQALYAKHFFDVGESFDALIEDEGVSSSQELIDDYERSIITNWLKRIQEYGDSKIAYEHMRRLKQPSSKLALCLWNITVYANAEDLALQRRYDEIRQQIGENFPLSDGIALADSDIRKMLCFAGEADYWLELLFHGEFKDASNYYGRQAIVAYNPGRAGSMMVYFPEQCEVINKEMKEFLEEVD